MANPFSIEPVNPLAALMAGQQGYDTANKSYKQNQIEDVRQQVAAGNIPPEQAIRMLIGRGDVQGAQLYAQQASQAQTATHMRATEDIARRQATLAETQAQDKPQVIKVAGSLGEEEKVFHVKPNGEMTQLYPKPGNTASAAAAPSIPPSGAPVQQATERLLSAVPDSGPNAGQDIAPAVNAAGAGAAAKSPSPYNETAIAHLNPKTQALIKGVASYDIDPNTFSTRGSGGQPGPREQAIALAKQYRPDYEQANFANRKRTEGSFNVGVEGRVTRAVGNLVEHLNTAEELARALKNGDSQTINAIKNKFGQLFGATAPTNAAIAAPIIGGEMTKVIAGANGGGVSERLENSINALGQAKTTDQLLQGLGVVRKLMVGQIHGLENQYVAGTYHPEGEGSKRYRLKLTVGARKMLQDEEDKNKPGATATTSTSKRLTFNPATGNLE